MIPLIQHLARTPGHTNRRPRPPISTTLPILSHRPRRRRNSGSTRRHSRRTLRRRRNRRNRGRTHETKELHILATLNRNTVTHACGINTLQLRSEGVSCEVRLRCVTFRSHRCLVIISEDAGPLFDGFVVVVWEEGGVGAAVVDLHFGSGAGVLSCLVLVFSISW